MSTSLRSWRRSYTRAARASVSRETGDQSTAGGTGAYDGTEATSTGYVAASMPETPPSCTALSETWAGRAAYTVPPSAGSDECDKDMKDVLQFLYCTLACLLTTCSSCRCQTTNRRCIQTKSPTKTSPTRRRTRTMKSCPSKMRRTTTTTTTKKRSPHHHLLGCGQWSPCRCPRSRMCCTCHAPPSALFLASSRVPEWWF